MEISTVSYKGDWGIFCGFLYFNFLTNAEFTRRGGNEKESWNYAFTPLSEALTYNKLKAFQVCFQAEKKIRNYPPISNLVICKVGDTIFQDFILFMLARLSL